MTAMLTEPQLTPRRSGRDFIGEAGAAADDARTRAQVARLLRLTVEAMDFDRDARRHDEAVAAVRGLADYTPSGKYGAVQPR